MHLMPFVMSVLVATSPVSDEQNLDHLHQEAVQVLVQLKMEGFDKRTHAMYRKIEVAFAEGERHIDEERWLGAANLFREVVTSGKDLRASLDKPQSEVLDKPQNDSLDKPPAPVARLEPSVENPLQFDAKVEVARNKTAVTSRVKSVHIVKKGETQRMVQAKVGLAWQQIAKANNLDPAAPLVPGTTLTITPEILAPKAIPSGVLVNIADRTLYLFKNGEVVKAVPVAVGRPKKKTDDVSWETPTGRFRIVGKEKDPAWRVPPNIQKEMGKTGKEVLTEVPPGPGNPLGRYALRTSIPGIMIHGTNAPSSVYSYSSHGCIRVGPEHIDKLFKEIGVSTSGEIVYEPVKIGVSADGRILFEAHPDVYRQIKNYPGLVADVIKRAKLQDYIDPMKLRAAVKEKAGMPVDVTAEHVQATIAHPGTRSGNGGHLAESAVPGRLAKPDPLS